MSFLAAHKLPFGAALAGQTATGTDQASALAITQANIELTTVGSGTGVRLPAAEAGMRVMVSNRGANTLNVFPATGASIDAASANVAATLSANTQVLYVAISTTKWYGIQTSTSSASGTAIEKTNTASNAFSVGNSIRRDAGGFALDQADSDANCVSHLGLIKAASGSNFTVVYAGEMTWTAHGFTVGAALYLSPSSPGGVTATAPSTPGQIVRIVAIVLDANTVLVVEGRNIPVPAAAASGTTVLETQVFS